MASKVGKLDNLTRQFLSTSDPNVPISQQTLFNAVQDPTYVSFKLDFFPHYGAGLLDDSYSAAGLFSKPNNSNDSFQFFDSAADYLYRIGAPAKQSYHRKFTNMLWRLQEESPWYFQSITGLGDLYKIDPANNFRGKDKILTIDCLESIDMRMTFLADLYRNFAFEMQGMREILPINLRTFNMDVHVLEFRKFNTTFGVIADALSTPARSLNGEYNQKNAVPVDPRNAYAGSNIPYAGANNQTVNNQLNNVTGGGISPVQNVQNLQSAFEAISVQTFRLKDCEFDFFSESQPYLDTVSVKDTAEATSRFKIKVGRIEKVTSYPFYNFILAESVRHTVFSYGDISNMNDPGQPLNGLNLADPYIEDRDVQDNGVSLNTFMDIREGVYPTFGNPKTSQVDSYVSQEQQSAALRTSPLNRALTSMLQNTPNTVNSATNNLNSAVNNLTGGLVGGSPLGNVYGSSFLQTLQNTIQGLLSPNTPEFNAMKNILTPAPAPPVFTESNVLSSPPPESPLQKTDVFSSPSAPPKWNPTNIFKNP